MDSQEPILREVQKDLQNEVINVVKPVKWTDDISIFAEKAHEMRAIFKDILILGTGGSSLGGQVINTLARSSQTRLHFLDNIDFSTFSSLLKTLSLEETGVVAISKSGKTSETLMQLLTCLQMWQKKISLDQLKKHFVLITELKDSFMRDIAAKYQLSIFEHPAEIGGRFSCFSIVGLFPALLLGLDPYALRQGGASCLQDHLEDIKASAYENACLKAWLMKQGKNISVFMPFLDSLKTLALWYRQLTAESLGKDGQGLVPIYAQGTPDLHSQLQLYLDGPQDKLFTFLLSERDNTSLEIQDEIVPYLHGKTMEDLFQAEQRATIENLKEKKCPVRIFYTHQMNEKILGALFMHFILETIILAKILNINAYNQPAVERIKVLTKEYLSI